MTDLTDKYQQVTLNTKAVDAIQMLLGAHYYGNDDLLFRIMVTMIYYSAVSAGRY